MNLYLRKNSHLTVRLSSLGFLVNQGEVQDAIIQDGRELYVVKKKKSGVQGKRRHSPSLVAHRASVVKTYFR